MPAVSLIGAPTDIGAGERGASMGPEALRVAQLGPRLERLGLAVADRGNLHGPANPWTPRTPCRAPSAARRACGPPRGCPPARAGRRCSA